MAIERAGVRIAHKPWGKHDLLPWSTAGDSNEAVGELCYERSDKTAPAPSLLFKLLFTSEPLSIQVHPDDTFAHAIGLTSGKSEAWYILSATPDAKIGIGLTHRITPQELHASIRSGAIVDLLHWRPVAQGDSFFVPAGTIHAIGAGIVLAEIQQNSDATFRLFDYGSQRELHEDNGVAVASTGPLRIVSHPTRLSSTRTVLVTSRYFVLEHVDLPAASSWDLHAEPETWILALEGHATIGAAALTIGQAIFAGGDHTRVEVGGDGLTALIAYPASRPVGSLLQRIGEHSADQPAPLAPAVLQSPGFLEVPA